MSRLPPEWPQPPKSARKRDSRQRDARDAARRSTADRIPACDADDGDDSDHDHLEQSVMGDLPGRAPRNRRWK